MNYNSIEIFNFINGSCDKVIDICAPLFQNFPFNQFSYMRFYDNGKIFRLIAHKEWSKKFLDFGFYNDHDLFHNQIFKMNVGEVKYIILNGEPKGEHQKALYDIGIWNIAIRYKKEEDFVESIGFGTERENTEIINLYLNDFKLLLLFSFYFKEKAKDLINKDHFQKLLQSSLPVPISSSSCVRNPFSDKIDIKRFWIEEDSKSTYLTKREIEIVSYIGIGKPLKEVAILLNISLRTVEYHLERIKRKLECGTKSEILGKFLKGI